MDNPEFRTIFTVADADTVILPISEYNELREARLCLDLIARSCNRFGVDDRICDVILPHFGYKSRADFVAEEKELDKDA